MTQIDLPPNVISLLAREAAHVKDYNEHGSPISKHCAQKIRAEIDRSAWVSHGIARVK